MSESTTPGDQERALAVRAVVARIGGARAGRDAARLGAIRKATAQLRAHISTWEADVEAALRAEVDQRRAVGCPPSFVNVAGLGHLERPLNSLFAWWATPDAGHGLSRAFLIRLARRAGAAALAREVADGAPVTVHAEVAVDDSGKMPDLLVRTAGGALLLENKHGAGETGDQFTSYPRLLHTWAADVPDAERRAVLCVRRDLDRAGLGAWHEVVLHAEIAALFRELVAEPGATIWGKISALTTAEAFEDREVGALLADACALLAQRGGRLESRLRKMTELADALQARPILLPWRNDERTR
jgi:hypothetical protein